MTCPKTSAQPSGAAPTRHRPPSATCGCASSRAIMGWSTWAMRAAWRPTAARCSSTAARWPRRWSGSKGGCTTGGGTSRRSSRRTPTRKTCRACLRSRRSLTCPSLRARPSRPMRCRWRPWAPSCGPRASGSTSARSSSATTSPTSRATRAPAAASPTWRPACTSSDCRGCTSGSRSRCSAATRTHSTSPSTSPPPRRRSPRCRRP
mmetsp:Transcript_19317/g.48599  ORF Transcript_19317/g.48599 Transcript_19317/m.48599 type:complete len:206 (-) Transcript_19317:437-1054(-)